MPSTSISKIAYDPDNRILSVWFVASGRRYDYEEVPAHVYASFRNAFSKGRFFNAVIRDNYNFRQPRERA